MLSGVAVNVNPGTYTAGETLVDGYAFDGFGSDCKDSAGKLTVKLGESKTCTLYNSAKQATITVVKEVDNSAGGSAKPDDFKLTLTPDGGSAQAVLSGVAVNVNPGTYTAGETLVDGYAFDGFGSDCKDSAGKLTVKLGESKTCTLYNSAKQATITVVKEVDNSAGGSAKPDDFKLTLTPDGGSAQAVLSGVAVNVNPGTYTAGETLVDGYAFDGFGSDCKDSAGKLTVKLGESKTCTLYNSAKQATITVVKEVDNSAGGSAKPDDFKLTLTPDGGSAQAVLSGVAVNVNPGTYTAGETLVDGYAFDGFGSDCKDSAGKLTVKLGESKTCTLYNSAKQATITVVKEVDNSAGGSAKPDDFKLTLTPDGGSAQAVLSGVAVNVNPGTYTAGETLVDGYAFDGFGSDCKDSAGKLTVKLGESKTCTLYNSAKQATITVVKEVDNSAGGSAKPDDFKLTLTPDGGSAQAVLSGVAVNVNPGTYTAGETLVDGYAFDGFGSDCKDSAGKLTVKLGESKTCTLYNSAKQATLTLEKTVMGGPADEIDFDPYIDTTKVAWDKANNLNPGAYVASEKWTVPDYVAGDWGGKCDALATSRSPSATRRPVPSRTTSPNSRW